MRRAAALLLLLAAGSARADRGALTFELGGGGSLLLLPAPYAPDSTPLPTSAWAARLGIRYAFSDAFEFALNGFFEPRVAAYHPGVTVDTSGPGFSGPDSGRGAFHGTLGHTVERYGLAAGPRWVWGSIFRLHLGGDLGWNHRDYADFDLVNTSGSVPRSHGLRLGAFSTSGLFLAPVVGLEWAFHDKWSVMIMPRVEFLLGDDPMTAFTIPLVISHSWYI